MAKKKKDYDIGGLLFVVSLVLAVVLGVFNRIDVNAAWILAVLGLLTGFWVSKKKDTKPFVMSGTILVLVSALGAGGSVLAIESAFKGLIITFAPAVAVIALRDMMGVARD